MLASEDSNGFTRGRSNDCTEGECVCSQRQSHLQSLSSTCNCSPRNEVFIQELCDQLRAECVAAEWSSEGILRRMEVQKDKLRLVLCYLESLCELTCIEERVGVTILPLKEG